VITGLILWWPRGQVGGVVSVRGRPTQRVYWRDLHAVTGVCVAAFILFLAVTGMPWSVLWGAKVNQWANGHNFGYPAGVRVAVPMSGEHLDHVAPDSWSLQQAIVPQSTAVGLAPLTLDQAIACFEALGIAKGYAVNPPAGPTGVYSASVYPSDLAQQRVIHLDQYTGRALIDMGYRDYGPLGRGLEWGINVHMGQEYGALNQWVLAAACAAIALLCVSAAVIWWKQRPAGALGVPPLPADPQAVAGARAAGHRRGGFSAGRRVDVARGRRRRVVDACTQSWVSRRGRRQCGTRAADRAVGAERSREQSFMQRKCRRRVRGARG